MVPWAAFETESVGIRVGFEELKVFKIVEQVINRLQFQERNLQSSVLKAIEALP